MPTKVNESEFTKEIAKDWGCETSHFTLAIPLSTSHTRNAYATRQINHGDRSLHLSENVHSAKLTWRTTFYVPPPGLLQYGQMLNSL